jgi:hypothetical protein
VASSIGPHPRAYDLPCELSLYSFSKEQFEVFATRLMPILEEVGVDPGEPEVLEVHNIIKR